MRVRTLCGYNIGNILSTTVKANANITVVVVKTMLSFYYTLWLQIMLSHYA